MCVDVSMIVYLSGGVELQHKLELNGAKLNRD
jgi:hypothetical protein